MSESEPMSDTDSVGDSESRAPKAEGKNPTSRLWVFVPPLLAVVAIGSILFVAKVLFSSGELEGVKEQEVPDRVIRAKRASVAATAIGYGTAKPARVWRAIAEVSGTVVRSDVNLRSGIRVERDALLVKIDELDYELREKQRKADLDSAKAGLAELLVSRDADKASLAIEDEILAFTEKERNRLLQLRESAAASQMELDRSEADYLRQKQAIQKLRNSLSIYPAKIDAARAAVALATSRLEEAGRDLTRTAIKAPFDGVLSGVGIEMGQVVNQSAQLFEVHDTDHIEIEAEFSPSQILPLMRGFNGEGSTDTSSALMDAIEAGYLSAIVTARSGQAEVSWNATPLRMSDSIDPTTRTLGIILSVDNTERSASPRFGGRPFAPTAAERELPDFENRSGIRLHPGFFCEVKLQSEPSDESILVPVTAIERGRVFVVGPDNRMVPRDVEVSFTINGQVVVDNGLEEGDLVVVRPPVPTISEMLVRPDVIGESDIATLDREALP